MYNYHSATPYIANTDEYPSVNERLRFLEAYVAHGKGTDGEIESVKILKKELRDWRVVNHAFWYLWGVVMSEDDPELILPNSDPMEDEVVKDQ
jgi:thiamine kinase-like enzyme